MAPGGPGGPGTVIVDDPSENKAWEQGPSLFSLRGTGTQARLWVGQAGATCPHALCPESPPCCQKHRLALPEGAQAEPEQMSRTRERQRTTPSWACLPEVMILPGAPGSPGRGGNGNSYSQISQRLHKSFPRLPVEFESHFCASTLGLKAL